MNEAGTFLRYVTPGVVYAVEGLVLLLLLRPDIVLAWFAGLSDVHVVGAVFGALLVSGGLGYMFSSVHHSLHWTSRFGKETIVDHGPLIRSLANFDVLDIKDAATGSDVPVERISREAAWVIMSGMWHERSTSSQRIEGACRRMWSLADLMHANGAARVASLSAGATAFIVAALISVPTLAGPASLRFLAALVLAISFIWIKQHSYVRVGYLFQSFIEQVLTSELRAEREQQRHPIGIYVSNVCLSPPATNEPDSVSPAAAEQKRQANNSLQLTD